MPKFKEIIFNLEQSAVELVFGLIMAAMCGFAFGKINRLAGILYFPYVGWLIYATYLNVMTYILNKPKSIEADKRKGTSDYYERI